MSHDRSDYKDDTKRPIVRAGYLGSVDIVDIGDLRVARGQPRHHVSQCKHRSLVYSSTERAIWCDECETRLDPFDVFTLLIEKQDWVEKRFKQLQKLEDQTLISRAAKEFDKQFRRRSMVPCCPHCKNAIFPEDVVKGLLSTNKELAQQARRFKNKRHDND